MSSTVATLTNCRVAERKLYVHSAPGALRLAGPANRSQTKANANPASLTLILCTQHGSSECQTASAKRMRPCTQVAQQHGAPSLTLKKMLGMSSSSGHSSTTELFSKWISYWCRVCTWLGRRAASVNQAAACHQGNRKLRWAFIGTARPDQRTSDGQAHARLSRASTNLVVGATLVAQAGLADHVNFALLNLRLPLVALQGWLRSEERWQAGLKGSVRAGALRHPPRCPLPYRRTAILVHLSAWRCKNDDADSGGCQLLPDHSRPRPGSRRLASPAGQRRRSAPRRGHWSTCTQEGSAGEGMRVGRRAAGRSAVSAKVLTLHALAAHTSYPSLTQAGIQSPSYLRMSLFCVTRALMVHRFW